MAALFAPSAWAKPKPEAPPKPAKGADIRSQPFAFTATDIARTIVETGNAVGPIVVGGPAQPQTLVSIFCIPPSFSPAVDAAADLPGPGAVALQGTVVLTP